MAKPGRRKRLTASQAKQLGRPRGRARIVLVYGETYEVLDLSDGGRKVFRLELEYIEPGSPEWHTVDQQIRVEEFRGAVGAK